MIWYGLEKSLAEDIREAAVAVAGRSRMPLVRRFIARRLASRIDERSGRGVPACHGSWPCQGRVRFPRRDPHRHDRWPSGGSARPRPGDVGLRSMAELEKDSSQMAPGWRGELAVVVRRRPGASTRSCAIASGPAQLNAEEARRQAMQDPDLGPGPGDGAAASGSA